MSRSHEPRRPDSTLAPEPSHQVDEEIAFHLDARTEQLVTEGLPPEAARARAEEEFGSVGAARSEMLRRTRRRRRAAVAGDLALDVRHALRAVRARPGAFAVAALSIALGMAAVSTMWTTLDRLVLRPLPYDQERTLVYVGPLEGGWGGASWPMSAADFLDLRELARTVELAAYQESGASLGGDLPEWVSIRRATPDFFSVLTVEPILGRSFRTSDTERSESAAILSHGFWTRRFGADPDLVGRTLSLDGATVTVVGVLPRGFELGRGGTDVWLPLDPAVRPARDDRSVLVLGRMHAELATVREELADLSARLAEQYPASNAERRFVANTVVAEISSGPTATQGLGSSVVAGLLVLLIACANVANLLLARGADRADEIALRRALGAGRGRIVWGLLVEAVLIALVGGAAGVALSVFGVRGLTALATQPIPRMNELAVDVRSMAVGMAVALGSVALFGVVPALRTLVAGERRRLLRGTRGASAGVRRGHSSVLVAFQVGVAVVLIATTALVGRSSAAVRSVPTGIGGSDAWSFRVSLPESVYPEDASLRAGVEQLRDAVAGVLGIERVGLSIGLPGAGIRTVSYTPPGASTDGEAARVMARVADPQYFDAIDVHPVRGRGIASADDASAAAVALVNESLARALLGTDDPVGQSLEVEGRSARIVGVLPDVRELGARNEPRPTLYLPLAQWPGRTISVVVVSTVEAPPLAELRRAVAALDGSPALRDVRPLPDVVFQSAALLGGLSKLLGVMAGVALFLAVIGVYAATSYSVVRRVPELGIRMALGADGARLRTEVLGKTLAVVAVGLAVGLPLAWAAGRGLSRFVFGSTGTEPSTYVAVALGLVAVSLAAAWTPASRAASVDPARSLRVE